MISSSCSTAAAPEPSALEKAKQMWHSTKSQIHLKKEEVSNRRSSFFSASSSSEKKSSSSFKSFFEDNSSFKCSLENFKKKLEPASASTQNQPSTTENTPSNANETPFGVLVVIELLAAKNILVGDLFTKDSDPYVKLTFNGQIRKTHVVKNTLQPVYNERFVFWLSPNSIGYKPMEIGIYNKNMLMPDELLGSTEIEPPHSNCSFDSWFPLQKKGFLPTADPNESEIRVATRSIEIQSAAVLLAVQSLASNDRCLNDDDLSEYGKTLPELWYGLAEAEEPTKQQKCTQDENLLTVKFNDMMNSRNNKNKDSTSSQDQPSHVF